MTGFGRSRRYPARAVVIVCCFLIGCASDAPSNPASQSQPSHSGTIPATTSESGASLDRDFPDPTVIRASDGVFYAYATQSVSGPRTVNIQVARSEDLRAWAYLGDALPAKPSWAETTQSFWAPHVVEHDGTFYLYFSAVPDDAGQDESCLAVATSDSPTGPFRATGQPLLCGYEIDPAVFYDPASGEWFVYWGSAGNIAVQRLSDDLTHMGTGTAATALLGWSSHTARPYEHGIEGPFVVYRHDWYYLFYSGDRCCEFPPHYAVLVARSRHPDGPFRRLGSAQRRPSSVILSDWGRWAGPGHCSIVRDRAGHDRIVYHAIDRRHPYLPSGDVRRVMLIDRLVYRGGWPVVARRASG